jgi:hypothetical protein
MKDLDQKIVAALYPLFGAFLGFLVFTFGTGGWWFVFAGKVKSTWVGPIGLIICVGAGAFLAWIAYRQRHHELEGRCLVALYFVWQLAKNV